MIHQNPAQIAAADWRDTVAIGDIIRWPLDAEDADGLALVVEIETIGGWRVLTVAPGVADLSRPIRSNTLRLTRIDEVRQSGIAQAVRFELDRRISLAPQHPGFDAISVSPVVGHLCESALERLHAARARIHALRDIAASRREERRQQHRAQRQSDRRTDWRPMPRPVARTEEDRAC